MLQLTKFQVDTFTNHIFGGNPAAVILTDHWLADDLMQKIAMENNMPETAFVVQSEDQYQIRWFTPETEVELCGHATIAAAFVIHSFHHQKQDLFLFNSERSGQLQVRIQDQKYYLKLKTDHLQHTALENPFTIPAVEIIQGKTNAMFVFANENEIIQLIPDFKKILSLETQGVIVTAPGIDVDFVSRFFGPKVGIPEDPVTGSAHATLVPYWAKKIGKNHLFAKQLSKRQGFIECFYMDHFIEIAAEVRLYSKSEIYIS